MKIFTTISAFLSLLLLTSCSQASFLIANAPADLKGVTVIRDIVYDSDKSQKLDIYVPANAEAAKADVLVFFYGGRWTFGNKEQYKFVAARFAQKGFIVVIPDYRKYPDVKFPEFIEDSARALVWAHDNIARYNGDPKRVHISGHSSGAHIAALLATDKQYLNALDKNPKDIIRSFIGLSGPYDFTPEEEDLKDMFGPPSRYAEMRPTTFITGEEPPMFLLTGADDTTVGLFNLENLKERIVERNGCVESKIYPDTNHIWMVAELSWLGRKSIADDMAEFFENPNRSCIKRGR